MIDWENTVLSEYRGGLLLAVSVCVPVSAPVCESGLGAWHRALTAAWHGLAWSESLAGLARSAERLVELS